MSAPEEPTWLTPEQSRAWLAWIRLQLRLTYEMNRQLQADSELSLPDWDVLNALSTSPEPMAVTALATMIGWERSRLSHHLRRMGERGLVSRAAAGYDRRVTVVTLTEAGTRRLQEAAPGHVALVRHLFFDGLPAGELPALTASLERIRAHVVAHGTLPAEE